VQIEFLFLCVVARFDERNKLWKFEFETRDWSNVAVITCPQTAFDFWVTAFQVC